MGVTEHLMSIDATAGMNSAWSSMRADQKSQAVQYAAMAQQVRAERGVASLVETAVEAQRSSDANRPSPPAPPGQGRNVDVRA
jgi:hypothetical protein